MSGWCFLPLFGGVFELEPLREGEVELNGGELHFAADGIDEFDVDFGAVEGGLVLHQLGLHPHFFGGGEEGFPARAQSSGVPVVLAAGAIVPGESSASYWVSPEGVERGGWRIQGSRPLHFRSVPGCRRCGRRPG
jgi:hypothetical protein